MERIPDLPPIQYQLPQLTLAELLVPRSSFRSDLAGAYDQPYVTTSIRYGSPFQTPTRPEKRRRTVSPCVEYVEQSESDWDDWDEQGFEENGSEWGLEEGRSAFRPFNRIPVECLEKILGYLNLKDLGRLQRVDKSFRALLTLPHLYSHLTLSDTNLHPTFLNLLPSILPSVQSLVLPSFPHQPLHAFLPAPLLSTRLTHLDLSFSAVTDELLFQVGNEALGSVKTLILKGCRGFRDAEWVANAVARCQKLDLSWSGVERLPSGGGDGERIHFALDLQGGHRNSDDSDDSGFFEAAFVEDCVAPPPQERHPFPCLRDLSLSSAPRLSASTILSFLASLPPTIQALDLSHLGLSPSSLSTLRSLPDAGLTFVNLTGNDALTRSNIENLSKRWGREVEIKHNAVLESDDVDDVRRFVELITGSYTRRDSE